MSASKATARGKCVLHEGKMKMYHKEFATRRELAKELSEVLDSASDEMTVYIDLTAQDVLLSIPMKISGESNSIYNGHEVVCMEGIDSHDAFRVMEDFARSRPVAQAELLFRALSRRGPFKMFRYALEDAGLLNDWYAYKEEAYTDLAESMLQFFRIDVIDGKIVCTDKSAITIYEAEETKLEDEEDA